jgi:F-type H+-transporting ATPase subunit gamma
VEPDTQTLLQSALPNLVTLRLYQALLASAAGEHGARMRAMDQATTNADQLIRAMTLERNRVRQAQITKELSEIVAGAEALQ